MNTLVNKISQIDIDNLKLIRKSVDDLFKLASSHTPDGSRVLEIAPQTNNSVASYIINAEVSTLSIDASSGCTYIADLCQCNRDIILDDFFDVIVCTEVLEHVIQPFDASNELYRMLKPGGTLYVSTPFNFRIHGPLPDCWRFTEHGLRQLFKQFKDINIQAIEGDRFLAPIHYTLVAKK
jgi:SAM-dependent methyltransferase